MLNTSKALGLVGVGADSGGIFGRKTSGKRGGGNEMPMLQDFCAGHQFFVLSPLLPEGEQDLTVPELIMRFYNLPMHHCEASQNYLVIGGYHA